MATKRAKPTAFKLTDDERKLVEAIRQIHGPWVIISAPQLLDINTTLDSVKAGLKQTFAPFVAEQARTLIAQYAHSDEPVPPQLRAHWAERALWDAPDGETYMELGAQLKKMEKRWEKMLREMEAQDSEEKEGTEHGSTDA